MDKLQAEFERWIAQNGTAYYPDGIIPGEAHDLAFGGFMALYRYLRRTNAIQEAPWESPAPTPEALDLEAAEKAALGALGYTRHWPNCPARQVTRKDECNCGLSDCATRLKDIFQSLRRRLRSLPPSAPASPTPGAQEEADMEPGKYLVLSIKWTRKADGVLTWWGPSDSGYHCVMDHAGRYTLDQIRRAPSYYNNRETTLAVPAGPANLLAVPSGIWNGRCVPYSKLKEIKAMAVTPDPLEGAGEGKEANAG